MLQRVRRTIGVALMTASLALGVLLAPVAVAEEVPEETQEATVTRMGYYSGDQSNYSDNVATRQFPPEPVCLVEPRACFFPTGEGDPSSDLPTGALTGMLPEDLPGDCATDQGGVGAIANSAFCQLDAGLRELLRMIAANDQAPEPNPLLSGTLPVSVLFGQPYHRSALEIELPELPEGETVDSFTMVLTQGQPTFANESPAFRQAVLAALSCASENEESPLGRCTIEEFEKLLDTDLTNDSPVLVEACPIVGDWEAGEGVDEDEIPEVDCLFAASGVKVEGEDAWVFDLTFAAQAWYDGTFPNKGLLLRPGAAENLAYGDPEVTYSKQVTFDGAVQVAMASSEGFSSTTSTTDNSFANDTSTGTTGTTAPPPPTTSTAPQTQSGGSVTPPSTSQPATTQQPTVEQPESSAPAPETAQPTQQAEQPQTLAAGTPLGEPENQWWLWLLVIPFLGGAFMLARSLEEEAVAATSRSGAMTRLLERQAAARSDDLVTG